MHRVVAMYVVHGMVSIRIALRMIIEWTLRWMIALIMLLGMVAMRTEMWVVPERC